MLRGLILVCTLALLLAIGGTRTAHALDAGQYIVQPGDTLIGIASAHGMNVNDLAAANGLRWNSWVYTEQQLVIPHGATAVPPPPPDLVATDPHPADPRVPDPLPALPLLPQEPPADVLSLRYARATEGGAPVYGDPDDAARDLAPQRRLGAGSVWVSLQGEITHDGANYYEINPSEYVPAEFLTAYQPSVFQGVALGGRPERAFAWILQPVQPRVEPGGEINPQAPVLQRYELVQIFATENLGSQVWYLIDSDQWINQIYVGKVTPSVPPAGVSTIGAWIEINLFEQTMAAYVGDEMVYATLVSTGLPGWDTPPGLFQIWLRVEMGKMSGAYYRPDYYFLEHVPWTLYFNQGIGFHTAYWHDGFGYRRSHGCVNLAPLDARWLFEWAPQDVQVWVHAT